MKKMNQPIDKLRRLEKVHEDLKKRARILNQERDEILMGISEGLNPVRVTEISKEVVEIRQKIARTKEIKTVLENYNISIDDVALVSCWRERLSGWDDDYRCFDYRYHEESKNIMDPSFNMWIFSERYHYGGPGDKVKVFFDRSKNSQNYICGFLTNFPLKLEKAG